MTSTDGIKHHFRWRHLRATARCIKPKLQYGLYLVSYEAVILCDCIINLQWKSQKGHNSNGGKYLEQLPAFWQFVNL